MRSCRTDTLPACPSAPSTTTPRSISSVVAWQRKGEAASIYLSQWLTAVVACLSSQLVSAKMKAFKLGTTKKSSFQQHKEKLEEKKRVCVSH